jgi:hypothetical protein
MTTDPVLTSEPLRALPVRRPRFRFGFFFPYTTAEKNYGLVIGLSVLTIFMSRFLTDGPPVAFTFLVTAAMGFFFKWRKMPVTGILILAYFLFAPLLIPLNPPLQMFFRQNHLEPMTVVLAAAVVIYLNAQYRLYSLTDRAMPVEKIDEDTKKDDAWLRSVFVIPKNEIVLLVVAGLGLVVMAEIINLLINEFYFEPSQDAFPIRLAGRTGQEISGRPGSVVPWFSRLMLTIAFLLAFTIVSWFVFWYWRLHNLTKDEGAAVIADQAWASNHPELRRNERWRAWAKNKSSRRSKS